MAHGSGDAGTKTDQPSDREGMAGGPGKNSTEAAQAAQQPVKEKAGGTEPSADAGRSGAAAEEAPKPKRRKRTTAKKADGTAAAKTDVDKDVAEAALSEGASEPVASAQTEEKPKPKRRSRAKAAATETAEEAPAEEAAAEEPPAEEPKPKPARRRRAAPPEPEAQPARRRSRGAEPAVVVRARARYVRTSARKARLVADHVRGKSVDEARAILAHAGRAAAQDWRKLLESAVANAEHNHELVGDDLRILQATADEGPTLKRYRPRAMGRATRINKRTSHLTITLTPKG
jgi:ribosomal protein L22